jgi:hypothetical protein
MLALREPCACRGGAGRIRASRSRAFEAQASLKAATSSGTRRESSVSSPFPGRREVKQVEEMKADFISKVP